MCDVDTEYRFSHLTMSNRWELSLILVGQYPEKFCSRIQVHLVFHAGATNRIAIGRLGEYTLVWSLYEGYGMLPLGVAQLISRGVSRSLPACCFEQTAQCM